MFGRPWLSTATSKKSSIVRVPSSQLSPWLQMGPLWIRPETSETVQSGAALLALLLCAKARLHRLRQLSLTIALDAVPGPGHASESASVEVYQARPTLPVLPATNQGKTLELPVPGSTACGAVHAPLVTSPGREWIVKMRFVSTVAAVRAVAGLCTSPV